MLDLAGIADEPLLIAIILASTSLGVIVPVLQDSGESSSRFGQLVIAAASIADFASVHPADPAFLRRVDRHRRKADPDRPVRRSRSPRSALGVRRRERSRRDLGRAGAAAGHDRADPGARRLVLLIGLVALAEQLGLELILGAFVAGAILNLLDTDQAMTHPEFRRKLAAVGFGVFIPVFFVASGVRFDLDALFASTTAIASIPVFLAALLFARGLPALLYRGQLERRKMVAAGLLQATSLPFIVAATAIGQDLGLIDAATSAGFIAAGLVTVLVFPITALGLLAPERRVHPDHLWRGSDESRRAARRGARRRTGPGPRAAGGCR